MEVEVELGLEPRDVGWRLAGQAGLDGQVQQDRQVGREAVRRDVGKRPERIERDTRRRTPGRRGSNRRTARR